MTLKTIICDDYKEARYIIKEYIKKLEISEIEVVDEASDGQELIEKCKAVLPDIVILDINMPNMNGVEAAKHLIQSFPHISFVFTTAYTDFAIEAFDVYAMGYIVKPISIERLEKTLRHIIKKVNNYENKIIECNNEVITISKRKKILVDQNNIIFVESVGRKILIHTINGIIESYEPMNSIEKKLNSDFFMRIHKSYLINKRFSFKIKKTVGRIHQILFDEYEKFAYINRENIKKFEKYII